MKTLQRRLIGLAMLAAGCGSSDSDFDCCASPRSSGAFFEITVHNFDPALYQIRLEWVGPSKRLEDVLLDVVDANESITAWHDAILGTPYWLVLADFRGRTLDSASLGSLSSASEGPVLATFLIAGSRFVR